MMTQTYAPPPPPAPDDLQRMRQQINELLVHIQAICLATDQAKAQELVVLRKQMNTLLKEIRTRVANDWHKAQDAINTLVRMQTAQELAALFLKQPQPYKGHAQLSAMIEDGLLHQASFIQKSPPLLLFYRRLFAALEPPPRSVLEIGVKGGGSTAFWKALFPDATVIGLDRKLRRWLAAEPSPDGVVYLQGDQTDVTRLQEIADRYGPFDLVIDDGSHVSDHQATTMRSLLPRVQPGGFYVIEDTHTSVKESTTRPVEYGDDIWPDFTLAVLERLRGGPLPHGTAGAQLADDLAAHIDELIIASRLLAIRAKNRKVAPAAPATGR
jgi:hypothetical protein